MAATRRRYHYHPAHQRHRTLPPRVSVLTAVGAVTEVIGSGVVTHAELQTFAELIADAIKNSSHPEHLAEQVKKTTPKFVSLNNYLVDNWLGILAVLVAVLSFVQDYNTAHKPEPAPTVVVIPPDQAAIERIVDHRLEELKREAAEKSQLKDDKTESQDNDPH